GWFFRRSRQPSAGRWLGTAGNVEIRVPNNTGVESLVPLRRFAGDEPAFEKSRMTIDEDKIPPGVAVSFGKTSAARGRKDTIALRVGRVAFQVRTEGGIDKN